MFKNIVFSDHSYGQDKGGFEKNYTMLKPYINKNINVINKDSTNDFKSNIENIYNICSDFSYNSIFIGGDHSIAISTVSAVWRPNMKLIWIDAHSDINTPEASITKNKHGMPLAYLTGLCENEYNINMAKVKFEDIIYIGLRSVDNFEKEIIEKHNIKVINYKQHSTFILNELSQLLDSDSILHISFDVDALSPDIMPCTGTREEDGIEYTKIKDILNYLLYYNINSIDIVELNFSLAKSSQDIITSHSTILNIFKNYNIFEL
tara:strand:+ start:2450 stop:3238 length:789 start_codon:yes stop_codon:yes gene_type:complete